MNRNSNNYCERIYSFKKFISRPVKVGEIILGDGQPIRLQSMTNTAIGDVKATVLQCERMFDVGADFARISVPHISDIESLGQIKKRLIADNYHNPIIADVHFNPIIAEKAARLVEKVRINPGNYIDKKSKIKKLQYSDFEYNLEIEKIHSRILPLIKICKEHATAIRIGSNHGSLSDRILIKYGNTIEGMVEAAMEFLRIFVSEAFYDVVVSMKASDARIMTQACRLLNAKMIQENTRFPQHLGVTEAGADLEGRLKSSVGIGALLNDGIGDTIRVSLTEAPEKEIVFAKRIVNIIESRSDEIISPEIERLSYNPYISSKKYDTIKILNNKFVTVSEEADSDIIYLDSLNVSNLKDDKIYITDYNSWNNSDKPNNVHPIILNLDENILYDESEYYFLKLNINDLNKTKYREVLKRDNFCAILEFITDNPLGEVRIFHREIKGINSKLPLILKYASKSLDVEELVAELGLFPGSALIDNLASGLLLSSNCKDVSLTSLMLDMYQVVGVRISKAEFISCPGCGRTNYDLEDLTRQVKEAFSNLKGLKIAVMGCIVNGPGEMADADYGCVGSGRGKVHIYRGKELVKKNISQNELIEELRQLILTDNKSII